MEIAGPFGNFTQCVSHFEPGMKIAFLSYEYPPDTGFGGIGTYTWYQSRALAKLGHEVHVLSGAKEPSPARMQTIDGVHVHRFRDDGLLMKMFSHFARIRMWWTRTRLENALCMFLAFKELFHKKGFDLIEMPECGAEGLLINPLLSPTTVVKFHSPAQLIMKYYYSRKADIRVCSFLEGRGIRNATAFSSPSRFLADEARKELRVNKPVRVIPYGIDLQLFDRVAEVNVRKELGIPANRPIILFTGRMEPRKGIHLCKEIVDSILSRHEVAFVFAGKDVFSYMTAALIPHWKTQNFVGSFHYIGQVDFAMIRSCLKQSQILLLPSLWDNTPYSCMEAMASRCAIVGSDHGGIPELIRNGHSGLLAKSGDAGSYVAAIERLLQDRDFRERLGVVARNTIQESFDDVHIARTSAQYYADVINNRCLSTATDSSLMNAEGIERV
jgi:glycosyltransferase involved in cell wall biosynthesis